jgi:dTDP-4-amino-4,6-dideoxygalactose transaminase
MFIPSVKPAVSAFDIFGRRKVNLNMYFKQNYYWTGSGSAAIYLAIKASGAKNIAIPAFTCSIVPDVVKKTEANVQYYDSGIVTTLSDIKKALKKKPDMIILTYNFGLIPNDIEEIIMECRKRKVLVLEDCAHAFGFGQNADFTIYSCGIAKSLSYYGGFLISKKKLEVDSMSKLSFIKEAIFFGKGLFSSVVFNAKVYGFISKIVFRTVDRHPKAKLYSISLFAKNIILNQINRFTEIQNIRNRNFKVISNLKNIVRTKQKSNLYLVLQTKNREKVIRSFRKKNIEILPAKSFFNLAGKGFPKAKQAEKEHLIFSLYRPKKEMEVFINAAKKIKF